MQRTLNKVHQGIAIAVAVGCFSNLAIAQDDEGVVRRSVLEEVIVTSQRTSENIQDVPIAVTALTGEMLENRQVINPSDLQLNAPNVSFTSTNFGSSSFSIRGIGRLVISRSGDSGVSTHINEIPIENNLTAIEFFDVERVELLRGPQGTLFGRNATGGAINVITAMPDFDGVSGSIDGELGDYSHRRIKGTINLPITDRMSIRASGMYLDRDGYIENLASGQENVNQPGDFLSGIDDDIDGRNFFAGRITALWQFSDNASLWVQYNRFNEDDDKVRITNQVCKTTPLPTTGCEADEVAFEQPHLGTLTANIFGIGAGILPLGNSGSGSDPSLYDFPRPALGFRSIHTDFEPIFQQEEDSVLFGLNIQGGSYDFSLLGGWQEVLYHSRQDYNMDVGANFLGDGSYPTSNVPKGANKDRGDPNCNVLTGNAGILGGVNCIHPSDQTRTFSYDQADTEAEYWTVEAKLSTSHDGPINYLVGINSYETDNANDYYVVANGLDVLAFPGVPNRLYPGYFSNQTNSLVLDGTAAFGELYWDIADDLKFTFGLRYNIDNKEIADASQLANSIWSGSVGLPGERWYRTSLVTSGVFQNGLNALSLAPGMPNRVLLELYATPAQLAALTAATAALDPSNPATAGALAGAALAIIGAVPIVPAPGENRITTGSPSEFEWKEWSGRIGLDWNVNENSLLYAFYSQGYKPGGFNSPINPTFQDTSSFSFDAEEVGSFEIGSKNDLLNGSLLLNATAFYYDYQGLQVTRIANNASLNDNIDASIYGLELESVWYPDFAPGFSIDASYSYLRSQVDGSQSIDPINRTAGNADWIVLQNIDPGSLTGVNYIAREAQITQAVIDAARGNTPAAALPPATVTIGGVVVPVPANPALFYAENAGGVAIPVYLSRRFLAGAGVEVSDGLMTDLDGNSLPNSPEHTVHLGVAYEWDIAALRGNLTARWDYYWQGDSYAREFNTGGDDIASWDQHNLSLSYASHDGLLQARLWVRNLQDEENITGKYLTSDTSGFFRNYFLTEPRIYGFSVRRNFGVR